LTKAAAHRSDFSSLAKQYAAYRTSYGDDLFDTIASFARASLADDSIDARPASLRALDLACGTGLSTAGLTAHGYAVSGVDIAAGMLAQARQSVDGDCTFYEARAEALPFADGAFELVSCAQAFHWFDAPKSLGEIARVLKRGGAVALYWKHALPDDPFETRAVELMREISGRDDPYNVSRSLTDRFEEFWSERRALRDHEQWRLPLELSFTVESFVGYHSSREIARFQLGDRRAEFLTRLQKDVAEMAPGGSFAVKALQYLFLARKR